MALPLSSFLIPDETESAFILSLQNLRPMVIRVIQSAHAPISNLPSVALGRGSSRRTFLGVNVELPGLPLQHSIHAEQFLVANLALNKESKLKFLAISRNGSYFHAPCGHCCQFLQEIRNASDIIILITDPTGKKGTKMQLSTFLPQRFSPYNTIPVNVSRLLEPGNDRLTFMDLNAAGEFCANSVPLYNLMQKALLAANRSYAPYSECPSGVALMDCDGKVYNGWYIESEAHNPSLGPVQVALVDFIMAQNGGHEFGKIVHAVLVEKRNSVVSQEATARLIIGKIAHPRCVLTVLHCS